MNEVIATEEYIPNSILEEFILEKMECDGAVKENYSSRGVLSAWWLAALSALSLAALLLAARLDGWLPEPRDPATAQPTDFVAQFAYDVLLNFTNIGPRVAGSYENEVLGAGAAAAAVRAAGGGAAPHHAVALQVHTASGAFPLAFFDGMTNVYRNVSSVVARLSPAGAPGRPPRPPRPALLLNCHYDTVPNSPGASDDAAGCAVLAGVLRALAAGGPLRHDVVFLFNGAEENIMQASHAFITTHEWAKSVRAFINIEACGAGGREVLFQAGPRDPWIMEVYAALVPRPFASSLAQELFESGLVPADTDFRVFRDFGNLSGVDLAWSADGYVYHTALDTAARVPLGALQRTGDNVLALARGLVASARLAAPAEAGPAPVFFDVLGACTVCVRGPAAAAAALLALLLTALQAGAAARDARTRDGVSYAAWARAAGAVALAAGAAGGAGLGAAGALGAALHAAGARLAFYRRPWLLAPLYAIPAVAVSWLVLHRLLRRATLGGAALRGWRAARLVAGALRAGWALLLAAAALRGARSGFVPALWALLLAAADRAADWTGASEPARLRWWLAGAALPALQTWYLSLGALHTLVPLAGRAGSAPPPDAALALLAAALAQAALSPLLPLVPLVRGAARAAAAALALCLLTALLVATTPLGAPYSAARPQRYMLLHARRTLGGAGEGGAGGDAHAYWAPHLDPNTPHSLRAHVPEIGLARASTAQECSAWPYCGAPYFLPVLGLVAYGHSAPAPPAPATTALAAATARLDAATQLLQLNVTGPSHIVVIISPVEGAHISWCSSLDAAPQAGAMWGRRRTYFLALHDARGARPWRLAFRIRHAFAQPPAQWAALSVAGHSMAAPPSPALAALLARFPDWTATQGWNVHQHLLTV